MMVVARLCAMKKKAGSLPAVPTLKKRFDHEETHPRCRYRTSRQHRLFSPFPHRRRRHVRARPAVILQLLDRASPESQQKVTGVMMELDDCAFPLLAGLENSPEATTAFRDADVALLVGARPRSKGMERADLLNANAEIFVAQGRALNEAASRDCKVLVVGNPCNTNAWIAMKSAPDLKPENFTSMRVLIRTA